MRGREAQLEGCAGGIKEQRSPDRRLFLIGGLEAAAPWGFTSRPRMRVGVGFLQPLDGDVGINLRR